MKRLALGLIALSLIFAGGCATPAQRAKLQQIANQPIYCEKGNDCEVKWGRAILWISNNSYWKIRQQTDNLITTEGPFNKTKASYVVNKTPLGGGRYQITMRLGCGNPFGCVPSTLSLKASFVKFVLGK